MAQLDPTSLKLFISVVETGTIAGAAQREHIAAAAISKRISELETLFGVSLIRRTNKGIAPTEAGDHLMMLARRAIRELDDIAVQMRGYAGGVSGQVRIAANISSIVQFLPADIQSFVSQHPQIRIQLEEKSSLLVVKALAEDAADIGVFTVVPYGHALQTFPYKKDRLVLVTPKGHVLGKRGAISFADTLGFEYVGLPPDSAISQQLTKEANAQARTPMLRIQVASYDAQCLMIGAGLGVGVMPHAVAMQHAGRLGLTTVALTDAWAERELRIGVRDFDSLPAACQLFVGHLGSQ